MKCILFIATFLVFQFWVPNLVKSQGKYTVDERHVDTLRLSPRAFVKTVAYQYHSVIFYVDYSAFKEVVAYHLTGNEWYKRSTYQATLNKLKTDIARSDTVYLSQGTFDSAEIIPFDDFLINQVENNNCVIRDSTNKIQPVIIKIKETKYYHPGIWGGRSYYLPGRKDYIICLTDIVS